MQWGLDGDPAVLELFSPEFHDHVSGQTGLHIFDVVAGWIEASFVNRRVEHHATMTEGDRVMVWYTQHGTHVGNGFPRMAGLPIKGAQVALTQVHIFRVDEDRVVEHWAVRDDYSMLEQIRDHADD